MDCTIAPLLWRLPVYGIDLGKDAEPIEEYMDRVFARRSFQQSLDRAGTGDAFVALFARCSG